MPNQDDMVRGYIVGEFRGDFPEIQADARVDIDALTAGDDKPFYLTLPVGRAGEVSDNGLHYDEELIKAIQDQIIGRGGIMGHIKDDDRSTAFPIEDVDWIGAVRQGDTLWGKGYIPPGEAREYVRRLMARGGRLATSIYGPYEEREALKDGTHRIRGLRLESLDLAPADRAALKLGGQFAVTAQMEQEQNPDKENDMELTKEQVIAELTADEIPEALRNAIAQEIQAGADTKDQIAELKQQVSDKDQIIGTLEDAAKTRQVQEFEAQLDANVAELVNWQVEGDEAKETIAAFQRTLRTCILSELGDERDADKLADAIKVAWDDNKLLAETIRDALSGPAARVSGKVRGKRELDTSDEAISEARRRTGI